MNNFIMRHIEVTDTYQPLSSGRLVGTVTISTPPYNSAEVFFKGDDGSDVPWIPGEWHEFVSVNLAEVFVKGNAGDCVTIVGGTW